MTTSALRPSMVGWAALVVVSILLAGTIRAMQRQEFNQDDIQMFKVLGVAGEGNNGLLIFFETERTLKDPDFQKFSRTIISEENEDRLTILRRIVATAEDCGNP